MRHSLLTLLFLFATPAFVFCLPFKLYNQKQDGELNVHAQLENFIIVLVPASGISWDIAGKDSRPYKQGNAPNFLQIFSRTPPFSSSPYKVDIDKSNVPLEKVSDDAAPLDNETFDPQVRDENVGPGVAQSLDVRIGSGGNTNTNEITKQNSSPDEEIKHKDEEIKASQDKIKEMEQPTEESGTKESTESKLAFSSTVTAQLDLTPEKKTMDEAVVPPKLFPLPTVQEPNNVITGKAVSAAVKAARFLNTENEKRVKILQSGLQVCAPGQRLTRRGQCVDTITTRQSRDRDLARLLSSLRFGLSPAASS